jgi:carnitine O-palmitoyltransferase 1
MAHVFESVLAIEFATAGYDNSSGRNKAVPQLKTTPKPPLRLRWEFTDDATEIVKQAVVEARASIGQVDQRLFVYDAYSKGFIKTCKVSPDAWLQMVLQLAFFRDQGHFAQTYEASMTRLYRWVCTRVGPKSWSRRASFGVSHRPFFDPFPF